MLRDQSFLISRRGRRVGVEIGRRILQHNLLSPLWLRSIWILPSPPSFANDYLQSFLYILCYQRLISSQVRLKTMRFPKNPPNSPAWHPPSPLLLRGNKIMTSRKKVKEKKQIDEQIFWVGFTLKDKKILTLNTLSSVWMFTILFSIHFL